MLRLFGFHSEQTPLEVDPDFKPLWPVIKKLNQRVDKLRPEAQSSSASNVTINKYNILVGLQKTINASIKFTSNQQPLADQAKTFLVKQLLNAVKKVVEQSLSDLSISRNDNRAEGKTLIQYGLPLFALPISGTALILSYFVAVGINHASGLSDIRPKSARIVMELEAVLKTIDQQLSASANNKMTMR